MVSTFFQASHMPYSNHEDAVNKTYIYRQKIQLRKIGMLAFVIWKGQETGQ